MLKIVAHTPDAFACRRRRRYDLRVHERASLMAPPLRYYVTR